MAQSRTPGQHTYRGEHKVSLGGGETQIVVGPSRLVRVIVTTTAAAAANFYDHASAAGGSIWLAIPASAPVGTIYECDLPMDAGIHINNAGLTLTVVYTGG